MLAKYIKYHPTIVGAYAQRLVGNYLRKEDMDDKVMDTKLKDKVYELSSPTTSADNIINELKTSIASANKYTDTAISKLVSLAKK